MFKVDADIWFSIDMLRSLAKDWKDERGQDQGEVCSGRAEGRARSLWLVRDVRCSAFTGRHSSW